MPTCHSSVYFKENMKALGAPVPEQIFDGLDKAIASSITILGTLEILGKNATLGEVIGATTGLEKLAVVAAVSASGYIGLVIGSIFVASGRTLGCGARISDVFVFVNRHNLEFGVYRKFYRSYPQITDKSIKHRRLYARFQTNNIPYA